MSSERGKLLKFEAEVGFFSTINIKIRKLFCPAGRPGTGRDRLSKSRPVPWRDFELVPLSLCPGTRKELLSLCPEKFQCPVPLFFWNQNARYTLYHVLTIKYLLIPSY